MNFIQPKIHGADVTAHRISRRRRARKIFLSAVAPIAAALLAPCAGAAVHLSGIDNGTASISQNGSVTTIKTSNNAILNFSQFNIARGSTVNFVQPSAASRELDRINSASPSMIQGSLLSNGTVYLINPAGVIFGGGAVVDVNRIYVAGSHMSDQDFLDCVDHFSGISGMVSNSGQIRGNQVVLVGTQVINQGSIVSPGGVVAMYSGSDVLVTEPGSHIAATVVPAVTAGPSASGGKQIDLRMSPMAAGDAYSLAIRHTGTIQASTVVLNGGGGQVQVSGSINASSQSTGGTGGSVSITGGEVDLTSADIDVSGPAGGGEIFIGGGVHGGGDLTHADIVSVDANSTLNADATTNGNGGTVVLWANDTTSAAGTLSARGGPQGGNGGYIETSAPSLSVTSLPDASAPNGKAGSWELDPATVTIVSSGGDNVSSFDASTLDTELDSGTSVTLTATGALTQNPDAGLLVTAVSPVSLVLQAGTTMTLSGGISTSGGSPLTVELDQLGGASQSVNIDTNPININGPLSIVGGAVSIAASTSLTAPSITIGSGTPSGGGSPVSTGTITFLGNVTSTAGNITLGSAVAELISSAVSVTSGNFSASGTTFSLSAGSIASAGGSVTVNDTSVVLDAPVTTSTGDFSVTGSTFMSGAATTLVVGTITTGGGTVTLTEASSITVGETVNTGGGGFTATGTSFLQQAEISDGGVGSTAGAFSVNTSSGTGTINIAGEISWTNGTGRSVTLEGGGAITITSPGGSIIDNGNAGLPVSLYTTGGPSAAITINGAGAINIGGIFTSAGGALTVASAASPVITAASVAINTVTTSPLDSKSVPAGIVTISGPVTVAGSFTAMGTGFTNTATITNGTNTSSTGSFLVNTSAGTGTITVGAPIDWAGTSAVAVTIEGGNAMAITANGSIDLTGGGAVSLFTTGSGSNISITGPSAGGAITTTGAFNSDGGNLIVVAPAATVSPTPEPTIISAGSISINTLSTATSTLGGDGKALTLGNTSISGPVVTTAGDFDAGGTVEFITNQFGTITTNGNVDITNTGEIIIGQPVATSGGNFTATMGTSFSTSGTGTITTTGGTVTLQTSSSEGITIANEINTGGGGFSATGALFNDTATITDGGVTSGTGSFSVNTTSGTGQAITISDPLTWNSHANESVTLEGNGDISITGTGKILATSTVSLYTTQSAGGTITLTGAVSTTGPFIASGGNFTVSAPAAVVAPATEPIILTATTISIETLTTTPDMLTLVPGTVEIAGPVVGHGDFTAGGTVSFISNQFGTIATNGGNFTITNPGLIAVGQAVTTTGGNFTSTLGNSFGNATNGTITTSGGNVTLAASTTDEISIGEPVNTGGGSFTATAMGMEITANISDGGVGTGPGTFLVDTTSGTDPITTLAGSAAISWTGGTGRSVTFLSGAAITLHSITATGSSPLPVTLYTKSTTSTDAITLNGQVYITGAFVASGQAFTIASGASVTANTVSINNVPSFTDGTQTFSTTPGAVSLSGPLTSHGTMILSGTTIDISSSGSIATNGASLQSTSGTETLIEGPVTTQGGLASISSATTLISDSDGTINSDGGDVELAGANGVSVGAAVNTGGGNFSSVGATFSNSAEISDGGVNDSKPQGLTISTSGGDISINGEISWVASFSPITLTPASTFSINLGASLMANPAEAINLANTHIRLSGTSATISGGDITLSPISDDTAGDTSFEIESAGTVSLQRVGTSAVPIGQLIVTNNGSSVLPTTTLNGNIFTYGSVDFAGPVILPANVQIADIDPTDTDLGIIEFDGTVEGPGGLTAVLPSGGNYGQIRFNADVGDVTPVAYLNLFSQSGALVGFRWGEADDPPAYPDQQPATVVNIASGGDFEVNDKNPPVRVLADIGLFSTIDAYGPLTINIGSADAPDASNLYAVGQNEKLSVYGSVNLNVYGGTIDTGDISSIGNMTLDAAHVGFLLRGPTIANNTVVDSGMDLIAAGKLTLPAGATYSAISGTKVPGSIDVPGFIAESYGNSSNIGAIASQLKTAFSYVGAISASVLFGGNNLLLDLTPNTLTTSIPTFVPPTPFVFDYPIAGAAPREQVVAGTVPFDFKIAYPPAVPGPIVEEDLKDTGIYSHDPTLDEIMGAIGTMAVYDDMPDHPRPKASDYQVVTNRLDSKRVALFLKQYKEMFGDDPASRRSQIASDIQTAWDGYVSQNGGGSVSGAGFAAYCAATPSAISAGDDLAQLHQLRMNVSMLGLSYKEAQVAFQYNMLAGLSAIGMREGDLATAVVNTPANK